MSDPTESEIYVSGDFQGNVIIDEFGRCWVFDSVEEYDPEQATIDISSYDVIDSVPCCEMCYYQWEEDITEDLILDIEPEEFPTDLLLPIDSVVGGGDGGYYGCYGFLGYGGSDDVPPDLPNPVFCTPPCQEVKDYIINPETGNKIKVLDPEDSDNFDLRYAYDNPLDIPEDSDINKWKKVYVDEKIYYTYWYGNPDYNKPNENSNYDPDIKRKDKLTPDLADGLCTNNGYLEQCENPDVVFELDNTNTYWLATVCCKGEKEEENCGGCSEWLVDDSQDGTYVSEEDANTQCLNAVNAATPIEFTKCEGPPKSIIRNYTGNVYEDTSSWDCYACGKEVEDYEEYDDGSCYGDCSQTLLNSYDSVWVSVDAAKTACQSLADAAGYVCEDGNNYAIFDYEGSEEADLASYDCYACGEIPITCDCDGQNCYEQGLDTIFFTVQLSWDAGDPPVGDENYCSDDGEGNDCYTYMGRTFGNGDTLSVCGTRTDNTSPDNYQTTNTLYDCSGTLFVGGWCGNTTSNPCTGGTFLLTSGYSKTFGSIVLSNSRFKEKKDYSFSRTWFRNGSCYIVNGYTPCVNYPQYSTTVAFCNGVAPGPLNTQIKRNNNTTKVYFDGVEVPSQAGTYTISDGKVTVDWST